MYTSGGKPFKPPVQERFSPIIETAHKAKLVLDGELYYNHNSNFGELSSTLSASVEVMAERNLRFHCFDAITYDEWYGMSRQEQFSDRLVYYRDFCAGQKSSGLTVPVDQHWCKHEMDADAYYAEIKANGGEGVIMRSPTGTYNPNTRSKEIVKRKVWSDCSAKIVAIHQLACPLKYADEIREIDGVKQGFKNRAGSVTVQVLPDQPLPAGTQQNTMFTPAAFHLRDLFWTELKPDNLPSICIWKVLASALLVVFCMSATLPFLAGLSKPVKRLNYRFLTSRSKLPNWMRSILS